MATTCTSSQYSSACQIGINGVVCILDVVSSGGIEILSAHFTPVLRVYVLMLPAVYTTGERALYLMFKVHFTC